MKIYLVQHGDAVPAEENPDRPLSEKGLLQVERMAEVIKRMTEYPNIILHSGKKRAFETAEMVSLILGGIKKEIRDYLNPKDAPDKMASELASMNSTVMIVGHMPYMARLVSTLLKMPPDSALINITNASPVVLSKKADGFMLEAYIPNEMIHIMTCLYET